MSTADYPMFKFAELKTSRNALTIIVTDQTTGKHHPFDMIFSNAAELPKGVYQPLGYGRTYVDRPDGKVRVMLHVRSSEGEKDYALLATPDETKQLEREFKKRFKALGRRGLLADSIERHKH